MKHFWVGKPSKVPYFENLAEFHNQQCNQTDKPCSPVDVPSPENATIFTFQMCVWNFTSAFQSRMFLIRKFVFGFLLPLIVIFFSYSYILVRLVISIIWISRTIFRTRKLSGSNRSLVRTNTIVLMIIVSFFVAWSLNHGLNFYMIIIDPSEWTSIVFKLAPISQVMASLTGSF